MNFKISTLEELDTVAKALLEKHKDARIFAFYGEMGVGKTTLIKAICKHLNITQTVNSPTFSLVNEYHNETGNSVFHFDFYRIKKISEVYDIGYEEYFYSGNYCFIEWPEKIEDLVPENTINIYLKITGQTSRLISDNKYYA